jgi:N-acetylneuraminate synthase
VAKSGDELTVSTTIRIGNRLVGSGEPVYVVAELSANHRQRYDEAEKLVRAAGAAGADAVKVQTFTPDTITMKSDRDSFRLQGGTLWDGRTLYELYEEAYMPWEWQPKLKDVAVGLGLDFFSSPFDPTAVAFLEKMRVPAYKVASFEIVDIPLIETIARTGKPMIISTGMATKEEIGEAVDAARGAGAEQIALLKCNSGYPAPPEEMNLRTIVDMRETFRLPIGLSDHTLGTEVSEAAVSLGACIIEKHFTLSRTVPGPDCAFSLEPSEFRALVQAIRVVEKSLGTVRYGATPAERKSLPFRRSLFVVRDVKKGQLFTQENVRSIRPGTGLHPRELKNILGRRAARDVPGGTPVSLDLVQ